MGIKDTPYGVHFLGKNCHLDKKQFLPGLLDKMLYQLDMQDPEEDQSISLMFIIFCVFMDVVNQPPLIGDFLLAPSCPRIPEYRIFSTRYSLALLVFCCYVEIFKACYE
ncbi:hypothetical protein STEG23_033137 [Scotinomys teguina]